MAIIQEYLLHHVTNFIHIFEIGFSDLLEYIKTVLKRNPFAEKIDGS